MGLPPGTDPYREIRDIVKAFDPADLVRHVMLMAVAPGNERHTVGLELVLKVILSTRAKKFQNGPVTQDGLDRLLGAMHRIMVGYEPEYDAGQGFEPVVFRMRGRPYRVLVGRMGHVRYYFDNMMHSVYPVRERFAEVNGFDPVDAICGMLGVQSRVADLVNPAGAEGEGPGAGWRKSGEGGVLVPLQDTARRFADIAGLAPEQAAAAAAAGTADDGGCGDAYARLVGKHAAGPGRSIAPKEMSPSMTSGVFEGMMGVRIGGGGGGGGGDAVIGMALPYIYDSLCDVITGGLWKVGNTAERVSDAKYTVWRRLARLFGRGSVYPRFCLPGHDEVSFGVVYDGKLLMVDIVGAKQGKDLEGIDRSIRVIKAADERISRGHRAFEFTYGVDDVYESALPDGAGVDGNGVARAHPEVIPVILRLPSQPGTRVMRRDPYMDERASWSGTVDDFAAVTRCIDGGPDLIRYIRAGIGKGTYRVVTDPAGEWSVGTDGPAAGGQKPGHDRPIPSTMATMVQAPCTVFEYARYLLDGYTLARMPVTDEEGLDIIARWESVYGDCAGRRGIQPGPEGNSPDGVWDTIRRDGAGFLKTDHMYGKVAGVFAAGGDRRVVVEPGHAHAKGARRSMYTREESRCVDLLMRAMSGRMALDGGPFGRLLDGLGVPRGAKMTVTVYPSSLVLRCKKELADHVHAAMSATGFGTPLVFDDTNVMYDKKTDTIIISAAATPTGLADRFEADVLEAERHVVTLMVRAIAGNFAAEVGDGGGGDARWRDAADRCVDEMFAGAKPSADLAVPRNRLLFDRADGDPDWHHDDIHDGTEHYGHQRTGGAAAAVTVTRDLAGRLESDARVVPGRYDGAGAARVIDVITDVLEDMIAARLAAYDSGSMLEFAMTQKGLAAKSLAIWRARLAGAGGGIPRGSGAIRSGVEVFGGMSDAFAASSFILERALRHQIHGHAMADAETWEDLCAMAAIMIGLRDQSYMIRDGTAMTVTVHDGFVFDVAMAGLAGDDAGVNAQQIAQKLDVLNEAYDQEAAARATDIDVQIERIGLPGMIRRGCVEYLVGMNPPQETASVDLDDLETYLVRRLSHTGADINVVRTVLIKMSYGHEACCTGSHTTYPRGARYENSTYRIRRQQSMPIPTYGAGGVVDGRYERTMCVLSTWLLDGPQGSGGGGGKKD